MHFVRNLSLLTIAVSSLATVSPVVATINEDLIYIRIPGHEPGSPDQTVGVPYSKTEDGKQIIDIEEFSARMRDQHDDLFADPAAEEEVRISGSAQYHENGDLDTFTLHADLGPEHYNKKEL